MKRAVIVFLMLCLVAPICIEAKKKPFGNGLYWELSDNGMLTISGYGNMPSFWSQYAPWYKQMMGGKINHVMIEEGVTSISERAFGRGDIPNSIKEITIPSSLIRIEQKAFEYAKNLSTINIPANSNLQYIGENAFYATKLKTFFFPHSLQHIGRGAFDFTDLTEVNIPNSVIEFQGGFECCKKLAKVILPKNIKEIPNRCFYGCSQLNQIEIPQGTRKIGRYAFMGCGLDTIIIPNTIKEIEEGAFKNCRNLRKIDISKGVLSIGEESFANNNLVSIGIPISVNSIGKNAFKAGGQEWSIELYVGEIICMPGFVESNPAFWGISTSSMQNYVKGVKNNEGRIIVAQKDGRKISNLVNNQLFIVEEKGKKGVINASGVWIVPQSSSFTEIELLNNSYIKVKNNNYYGIISLDGKEIIPTSRGYTSISSYNKTNGTFAFTKRGMKGICDTQGKEISTTRLAPTTADIKADGGYTSAVAMNNGSTNYYKVSKSGHYGLTDSEGREIIPCEMEALESAGSGYLKYKLNGFWGIMNYMGKIIIDTDRGYTSIGDFKTFNKRFAYTMTGFKGECDATGRQISKIKVETPKEVTMSSSTNTSVVYTDLSVFDLKGRVKNCQVNYNTWEFDKNGTLIEKDVVRDSKGRISKISINALALFVTKYEYDSNGRVAISFYSTSALGKSSESKSKWTYDRKGQVIKEIVSFDNDNYVKEFLYTFSDYVYDSHGNWISRRKNGNIETRTIEYY